jgi:hypothetical protein
LVTGAAADVEKPKRLGSLRQVSIEQPVEAHPAIREA